MAFFVMDAKYCDIVARNVRPKIGNATRSFVLAKRKSKFTSDTSILRPAVAYVSGYFNPSQTNPSYNRNIISIISNSKSA
jgi:hypothetical protein